MLLPFTNWKISECGAPGKILLIALLLSVGLPVHSLAAQTLCFREEGSGLPRINPSRGETSVAYIRLLPNPVGKVTNTSIPLIKASTAVICSGLTLSYPSLANASWTTCLPFFHADSRLVSMFIVTRNHYKPLIYSVTS